MSRPELVATPLPIAYSDRFQGLSPSPRMLKAADRQLTFMSSQYSRQDSFMAQTLIISIVIRLIALFLSIAMFRKTRDWRLAVFPLLLILMFFQQAYRLMGTDSEMPELIASILVLLSLTILSRLFAQQEKDREAIRESEERYRTMFETSPDAITVCDSQFRISMINRRGAQLFGYEDAEEMIGKNLYEFVSPESTQMAEANIQLLAAGNELRNVESLVLRKDGSSFPMESNAAMILDALRKPKALIAVSRDINERKRAETELKQSREQLRALTLHMQSVREEESRRIAREIHDELGSALTGLKWDMELMEQTLLQLEDIELRQMLEKSIHSSIGLIDETTNTVRRISSELRPGILDDLGLVEAIEWQTQQFQSRTGLQCHCDASALLTELSSQQSTVLFRIFQEILTNVLRHAQATCIRVYVREGNEEVILRVEDNGLGITERAQSNLHSLGLLGMRERAFSVGGEVTIVGEKGSGTTVSVRIPVSPQKNCLLAGET
jgi:PAS domain S-box-containing protein